MKSCEYAGKRFPSKTALAKAAGISPDTLRMRLTRGATMEEALVTPVREQWKTKQHSRPTYLYKGKRYALKQLPTPISYKALYYRIVIKNWSVEDAVEIPPGKHRPKPVKHVEKAKAVNPVAPKPVAPKKAPVTPKSWLHRRSMAGCKHTNFDFDTKSRRCRICGAVQVQAPVSQQ